MKKATFMNLVTVAAYAAIAVYIFVALVTFFVWVTGGFRKYTDQAGGLKFDCMAVSIADNYDEEAGTGIANLRVLSEKAVAKINTRTQKVEYSDPSEPIEIRLEVRDENGKLNNKIIDVPSKVMLGEEFQIKAVLDNDGFNKGGDCFLYAFSGDDMLSASPLPVFVDVPIQSASLLYYNIDVDPATMYKRVITQERKKTVDEKEVVDYFQTTLLYRTLQDYQNDVNAIVPLNRKTDSSSVENNALSSRFLLGDEQSVQHYKDLSFVEDSVQCVKDDQFKLYVEVYPSRAINPHSNTSISSQYLLNNLDAESIYAVCQDLIAQYNKNKDSEEAMQTYLQMFSNVWDSLGINGYVDVSGLITKTRISQAIERISAITVAGIQNYYSTALFGIHSRKTNLR